MRQLSRNVLSTYVARAVSILSSLALFPFIAHNVGLADYGILLLFGSIAFFFALDFGLSMAAVRYTAESHARGDIERLNRVVSSTVAFFAVVGLAMTVLFVAGMLIALPKLNVPADQRDIATAVLIIIAVGTLALGLPLGVFSSVLGGLHRFDIANLIVLVQVAVRVGLTVGFVLGGLGVVFVAVAQAASVVLGGLLALFFARRIVPELHLSRAFVSPPLLREMAPFSAQVFVLGLAAIVILQADNLIISIFLPVASVTLYTAAFRIYQVCREVGGSLLTPLVSAASRAEAVGDRQRLGELFQTGTKYANAAMLALVGPAIIFAEPLLAAWAGEQFTEVALTAQILLIGLLFNNQHLIAVPLMMGIGRLRQYVRYHVAWATANIVLSVILVQRHGLVGMALGTAIPVALLEPLYLRTAMREFGVSARDFVVTAIVRTFVPALLAAVPATLFMLVWEVSGIIDLALGAAIYGVVFVAAFLVIGLQRTERRQLVSTLRGLSLSRAPQQGESPVQLGP